jgi:hypothetical protein
LISRIYFASMRTKGHGLCFLFVLKLSVTYVAVNIILICMSKKTQILILNQFH